MLTAFVRKSALSTLALLFASAVCARVEAQSSPFFAPGNLVVVVEGCGVNGGTCTAVKNGAGTGAGNSSVGGYGDNQAAPLTLFQYKPTTTASASFVNSLVLPQAAVGANLPVAGEYGSSSEGGLQLSGAGQYLTLMGYGINADVFNAAPATYGAAPSLALAQSGSLTGQTYTPIARTIVLVDAFGNVNSSTPLYNVFNTNNPRSIYTLDGVNAWVSGQGSGTDATGGVFYTPLGAINNAPVSITGLDAANSTTSNVYSQDTRNVQVYNNTLYISVDTKGGTNSTRSYLGTLGTPPSTSLYASNAGPTEMLLYNNASPAVAVTSNGKITLTASEINGINASGNQVNLSPSGYFFAAPNVLYIADTGYSKQTSAKTQFGDGGLQKWVNTAADGSGQWQLMYTLAAGLNLVASPNQNTAATTGATGLYSLAGVVSGGNVYLYAVNYNIADLDPTYLYGITDTLTATTTPGNSFTQLAAAPADSNFKGVSFAPTSPAASATLTTVPSGLTITTAGTGCVPGTYVTPVTLVWTPGSTCTLSTVSHQTNGTTPLVFTHWQDNTTSTSDAVIAPATAATYTATFSSTGSDFTFASSGSAAQTVTQGGTATYAFALGELYPSFPGAVTFSATGLPAGTTATFSPTSVAQSGASQTVTLTVTTSAATPARTAAPAAAGVALGMALLLLPLCLRRKLRPVMLVLLVGASLAAMTGLTGCSGTGNLSTPGTVSSAIVVTATSGSVSHSATVQLTVTH